MAVVVRQRVRVPPSLATRKAGRQVENSVWNLVW